MQYEDTISVLIERIGLFPSLCLYGAGDYAEMIYSILNRLGIPVKGVIVSSNGSGLFHGIPISNVGEVFLEENDVVIGAYDGATVSDISERIGNDNEIIIFSDEQLNCIYNEVVLAPLLGELDKTDLFPGNTPLLSDLHRILIIRLDSLGDLVMTSAFVRELHRNCPTAEISLIVRTNNAELYENCPYINNIICYDCPQMVGTLSSQVRAQEEIKKRIDSFINEHIGSEIFDAVILPRELLQGRSCYEEFLLAYEIPAKYKMGRVRSFSKEQVVLLPYLENIFTVIKQSCVIHETEYMLGIINYMKGKICDDSLQVWCRESNHDLQSCFDDHSKKYVVLGLNAATPSRVWPIEKYEELITFFNNRYGTAISFVLLGDESISQKVSTLSNIGNVFNFVGKTSLSDVNSIMKRTVLYVGSNTGLMHMAVANKLPCVVLYATLPDIKDTDGNSPLRMGAWKVSHVDLMPHKALEDCIKVCKKPYSHCISTISVDDVYDAMRKLLKLD